MKKVIFCLMAVLIMAGIQGCSQQAENDLGKVKLESFTDKVSYVLGADIGSSLRGTGTDVNRDALFRGIDDSLEGKDLLIDDEEMESIKQQFAAQMQEELTAKTKEMAETNLKKGETFLAENKTKEGVMSTESGLQYKALQEGNGVKPQETDRVKVHYRGTLLNGKEFDSSYKRGEPAVFQLNAVIPGWAEGLQLMSVGSKFQLFIPANLAYGERGVGPDIEPNSTLIFEVELLGIEE